MWLSENNKILVVDDDPIASMIIVSLLKKLGQDCIQAKNGIEALDVIEKNQINRTYAKAIEIDGLRSSWRR